MGGRYRIDHTLHPSITMAIHPGVMCLMSVTNTPVLEEMEDCELPPNDSVLRACMKLDLPELKKCD